jgi:hypothetical protein
MNAASFHPTDLAATLPSVTLSSGAHAATTLSITVSPAAAPDLSALQAAVATTLALRPMPTKRAPTLRLAVEALKRGETPFLPQVR